MKNSTLSTLKVASAPIVLGFALFSAAASAQTAGNAVDCKVNQNDPSCVDDGSTIVVTGSIIRRAVDAETPSPVTTVTTQNLDQRGVSTIQDGLQMLAANNGPALTNSFTANGAFAGGASAVSLRGLSTNSSLVLFDGLRAAYYPLADDGSRNFVDLNTIPDDIVERFDVVRDGASSTYGADAIAGVVNIITKRQVQGIMGRVESGISSRGDGGQYRASLTVGKGDIDSDGFNVYVSGYYYKNNGLLNKDRGYPFNTDNLTKICEGTNCGPNNIVNASTGTGPFPASTGGNFLVRPGTANTVTGAFTALTGSTYQNLSGCGVGTSYTLTAAELAGSVAPATVCQYDYTNLFGNISPEAERYGVSSKATAKFGDTGEAYIEVNFMQSKVSYFGTPASMFANAPTGISYPRFSTSTAFTGANAPGSFVGYLPVYVCPERVNCATSANRKLNPNNPFAAQGLDARIIGRDMVTGERTYNETRNRAYRAALGVRGELFDNLSYDVSATVMHTDLRRTQDGYVYIQRLLDVIRDGSYNFVNPALTPQSVRDYLTPVNTTNASSDLAQVQATFGTKLMDLPGGPLQFGFGATAFYEAVDAPSANPDYNGPTQRYFTINAFGTKGNRTVTAAFAEVEAPVLDILTINASGRYDHYSSGQGAFSPKIGAKFTPMREVILRATWSKGFRIPSFAEANALPTTGYVTNSSSIFNDTYLAQYGCTKATFSTCPAYIRSGSYGQTSLASPNLDPERSRSWTAGIFVEPIRNFSLSADFYDIRKTGAITSPSNSPALLAYYSNQPIPAGYVVIPDAVDVNYPNARPRVAFVQAQLVNADTIHVQGLDFGANGSLNLTDNIKWSTSLDASYILKLETTFLDGSSERYDGTLGNFNLTAGSGTPKWHGNWRNTFEMGKWALSGTVNYFGGYNLSAMDQGTGYKDCGMGPGYTKCDVPAYVTLDLNLSVKVSDQFTLYANMLNAFDKMPPIDPETYGAHLYNPVQGGTGILGRYFKAGVKFNF